jgi:hypothetical protein
VLDGLRQAANRKAQFRQVEAAVKKGGGADRALPDLSSSRVARVKYALPVLRFRRHPGEGFSRPAEDGAAIRRRRVCPDCGGRFTTFERVQLRDLLR